MSNKPSLTSKETSSTMSGSSTSSRNSSSGANDNNTNTTNNHDKNDIPIPPPLPPAILKTSTFLNYCSLSHAEMKHLASANTTDDERNRLRVPVVVDDEGGSKLAVNKETIVHVEHMSLLEEIIAILFLSIAPANGVVTIPLLTTVIGICTGIGIGKAFQYLFLYILVPLAIVPQSFISSSLTCYLSYLTIKYFSFRFITVDVPPSRKKDGQELNEQADDKTTTKDDPTTTTETIHYHHPRPHIMVAPPHGVFPYGNLLSMLVWPALTGHHFFGLAANSALRTPVFKQILCSMGVIDASRTSATAALQKYPYEIGISTGGVAEVFETSHDVECIILRERIGLIKLAIRTGSDLVPCYLFGNTHLLSCWSGDGIPYGRYYLEKISRKIGFALILFYGRWFLPIPRRIPILGVRGKPISTIHMNCTNNPTIEQINEIQNQLINDMQLLFDTYKHLYGWETKQLIIK